MKLWTWLVVTTILLVGSRIHADTNPSGRLAVHEWGTFTALQAEDGKEIPGINTDDEPLPAFVHNLHGMLVAGPSEVPNVFFKGAPRVHPDVIVRLETPVIYFHPPKDAKLPLKVDVDVSFNGGWLTQFYPDAKAAAPGLNGGRMDFGALGRNTVGSLSWKNLKVGGDAPGPETTSPVWLAPRAVDAASVTTEAGETERYLFYRGVGNVPAPLKVVRSAKGDQLTVVANFGVGVELRPEYATLPMLLVDVRGDGAMAFRSLGPVNLAVGDGKPVATTAATFAAEAYADANRAKVREHLHAGLMKDGLHADEADGLLNTWDASYFRRPGLRLFFLVPRQWTDHVLPLKVSVSCDTVRSMIGRIEIVTPAQRELLREVSKGPVSDSSWIHEALKQAGGGKADFYREEWYQQVMEGSRSLTTLNVPIPGDYRSYLALGRFRNALVLDEQNLRPSPTLLKFIQRYALEAAETEKKPPVPIP